MDNEHMNKKKSKICCQYEKPHEHKEGEEGHSSCESSDEDERNSYDRPPKH